MALKNTRFHLATFLMVGLVLGVAAGLWLGSATAPERGPSASVNTSGPRLTKEQAMAFFVPNVTSFFLHQSTPIHLGLKGWSYAKDSSLVLQIDPVTSDWKEMDDQTRINIVGLVAAGYDQALRSVGIDINPRAGGFPVVHLIYAGQGQILASRIGTGQIYLYDHSTVGTAAPNEQTSQPQPASPGTVPSQPRP